ncbi:MAG: apolipoprotein N-acyltransferase [Myxococcales bacterium]|nr:apolipoprotein N-acyltransferase [Myxococcales bacterium]
MTVEAVSEGAVRPQARLRGRAWAGPAFATLASGALYGAAFPPFSQSWLAWGALAPFFGATTRVRPVAGAALGGLFALSAGTATAWWLPEMLERFFDLPRPAADFALAGALLGTAGLEIAAFGAWLAWLSRRGPVAPATVGIAWALTEWTRGEVGPLANPWALLSHSQIDWAALSQIAELTGPHGVAFLAASSSALLASLAFPALRGRHPAVQVLLFAALGSGALLYGQSRLGQSFDEGAPVRVAIVQADVTRHFSRIDGDSRAELERHLALTEQAEARSADFALWPEGAADFFLDATNSRALRLRSFSRKHPVDLVLGAPRREPSETGTRIYNSTLHLRGGRVQTHQDKLELTPFSESQPLAPVLSWGSSELTAGDAVQLLEVGTLQLGSLICSEAMGSRAARERASAGATLLINPSNDYWFAAESGAAQQLQKSRLRAIETRRWLARATPTGYSAIVDAHGTVRAIGRFGASDLVVGEVFGATTTTLSTRYGGAFGPALFGSWLLLTLLHAKRFAAERKS